MEAKVLFNPFPGLRPFEPDEDHLFFGREKEIDELLRRLRTTRFLQVIGTSGCGKSSLVRSGLIPALYSGFMAQAGSGWRVLIFRPGEDPIGHLAAALNTPEALGIGGELAGTSRVLLEATLRRGTLGLVEVVRQARIPPHDNLLVVVDQFEELFRFRRSDRVGNSRDEAVAFFKLLLEASNQNQLPIYVVLTMRADFIGDCMEFPGLPEAVNAGMYLVPRMTRDELRSAITGPIAVAGGEIAQRLVLRLLNDIADDTDQLPVLQHVLMRTWDHWETHRQNGQSIDIADYEAVGTLKHALSWHADEAFDEAGIGRNQQIAEKMFKALTDTFSDLRGVRRPTSVQELAAICEAFEPEVIQVVESFRYPGRSFLTPSVQTPLDSQSIIDISHESLMRCWTRLITWAEEERESATSYMRISQAAVWCEDCSGGLWIDPQLEIGLQWKRKNHPTQAWAERYDSNFAQAMDFLDRSEKERETGRKKEHRRKRTLQAFSFAVTVLLLIVGVMFRFARKQANLAEQNLLLAKRAVDESLSAAGGESAREAADTPQMEQFRNELLEKARTFYLSFTQEKPKDEKLRNEAALAHSRLGDSDRLLERYEDAVRQYEMAIADFGGLLHDYPRNPEYRQRLAYSHQWLAETLRIWLRGGGGHLPLPYRSTDAEDHYNAALHLQQQLQSEAPTNTQYRQELARTYYNRGILHDQINAEGKAEADFAQAIRLLEPLVPTSGPNQATEGQNPPPAQDLARVYNNMGLLLLRQSRLKEAQSYLERATSIHEQLVKLAPDNREYKYELAVFSGNLALLLWQEKQFEAASERNDTALDTLDELAMPAHSLDILRASAHVLQGLILESANPLEAQRETDKSVTILEQLKKKHAFKSHPEGHVVYLHVAYNYLELTRKYLDSGSLEEARIALNKVPALLPDVRDEDRPALVESYSKLHNEWLGHSGQRKGRRQ
jgi:tetratricopeptide (TPR) repeat protein